MTLESEQIRNKIKKLTFIFYHENIWVLYTLKFSLRKELLTFVMPQL